MIISIVVLLSVSYGITKQGTFEDESLAWTPRNKPAIEHYKLIREKFPSNVRPFVIFITDKNEDNIITVNHFNEIQSLINKVTAFSSKSDTVISDFCLKVGPACLFDSNNPLF